MATQIRTIVNLPRSFDDENGAGWELVDSLGVWMEDFLDNRISLGQFLLQMA